tara:strand:- start:16680 stop:17192 length:513 start_codon:yes stop_codon:yes gene_type:complete
MASELQLYADPNFYSGKTVFANLYLDGIKVGSSIATVEVGGTGIFIGDMPLEDANVYAVRFTEGSNIAGQGEIDWDGEKENTLADLVYDKFNPPIIDPKEQYHAIETYFKGITRHSSLTYTIKLNDALRDTLEVELGYSGVLTTITVLGLVLTILIDNSLADNTFVIYGS